MTFFLSLQLLSQIKVVKKRNWTKKISNNVLERYAAELAKNADTNVARLMCFMYLIQTKNPERQAYWGGRSFKPATSVQIQLRNQCFQYVRGTQPTGIVSGNR